MIKSMFGKKNLLHINHKILLSFFVIVLILYSIGLYINICLNKEVQKSTFHTIQSKSNYLSIELESSFEHINKLSSFTVTRYSIRKLVLYNKSNTIAEIINEMRTAKDILSSITSSSSLVDDAAVYMPELGVKISSFNYSENLNQEDMELLKYYYTEGSEKEIIVFKDKLYMVSSIYSPNDINNDYPSALVIKISSSKFTQYIMDATNANIFSLAILVGNSYIMDSDLLKDSQNDTNTILNRIINDSESIKSDEKISVSGEKYLIYRKLIPKYDIEVVSFVNVRDLTQGVNQFQLWSLLFTAISGLAFISFLLIINHLITQPIKRLTKTIEQLETEDILEFDYAVNDINLISQAFNKLTIRLKSAMEQSYNNKLITQQSEMKYLQAQINPHFLYNSFFHLYQMGLMEDYEGVAEMSKKLGKYYQYVTRSTSSTVPFIEEYTNAMDYADIQSIRFNKRISANFSDLSSECKIIQVPRFILQPIMENAYEHGVDELESGGLIIIEAKKENDMLNISIEDNGEKINSSEIGKLSKYLSSEINHYKEITGLKNVKHRVELYGGTLKIMAGAIGGLKVMLYIPVEKI